MSTNFLYAQAPNRKGNQSKHTAALTGGVTAVTGAKHGVAQPLGSQGAPKAGGNVYPVGNKVSVSKPKADYCANDGYRSSSFLK
jgi:putative hemolysin